MPGPRVLICDVDGTLVDSAAAVIAAMQAACAGLGLPAPSDHRVRSGIGLSLPRMTEHLGLAETPAQSQAVEEAYRAAFFAARTKVGARDHSPLYPGAEAMLRRLAAAPETVLAIATGKSRRGVDALIDENGLAGLFASIQTADGHPSKPHPSMVLAVLAATGAAPGAAAMLGDTTYDMQMARAAGVATIGVGWGYHAPADLDADRSVTDFAQIDAAFAALTARQPGSNTGPQPGPKTEPETAR